MGLGLPSINSAAVAFPLDEVFSVFTFASPGQDSLDYIFVFLHGDLGRVGEVWP
jgi:hypothetical protein